MGKWDGEDEGLEKNRKGKEEKRFGT